MPHGIFRQDRNGTAVLGAERLDRLDRFFADLMKAGVYSLRVLGMGRPHCKMGEGACAFEDAEAARAAARIWYALPCHVNFHAALRWADDPVIAAIEILHEASLSTKRGLSESLPDSHCGRVEQY